MSIKAKLGSHFSGLDLSSAPQERGRPGASTSWPQMHRLAQGIRHALNGKIIFLAEYDIASGRSRIDGADNLPDNCLRSCPSCLLNVGVSADSALNPSMTPGKVWTVTNLPDDSKEAGDSESSGARLLSLGVTRLMGCIIGRQSTDLRLVSVGRGEREGPFQPLEAELFSELLSPTYSLPEGPDLVGQINSMTKVNLDVLDLLPVGIVLLDGYSRPLIANRYAMDSLHAAGTARNPLSFPKFMEIGFQRRRPANLPAGGNGGSAQEAKVKAILMKRPQGEGTLSGLIYPLNDEHAEAAKKDEPAFVMFISDPNRPIKVVRERLEGFYGLTPAEARITALLAEGSHLEEVSASLGISLYTARTHLKRIFSKTGTQTQADLIRLALDLSARIGC